MSESFRHFYYNNGFHEDNYDQKSSNNTSFPLEQYPYSTDITPTPSTFSADHHPHQMFEYPSHISSNFHEIVLQGSNDQNSFSGVHGMTVPSSSEVLFKEEQQLAVSDAVQVTNEVPATPNSSISSDSTEAATGDDHHIRDSNKGKKESGTDDSAMKGTLEDNEDPLKKEGKGKKKAEKKQRPPRFAFMTKSDVDHLEDGYRWRKYGQKAVKNSRYPRSYYRCTTQKCPVKKRIERSFQDPSIVITTYEGQHNHHVPANLRGNVAAGIFPPPMFGRHQLPSALDQLNPSFHHQEVMLSQMPHYFYGGYGGVGTSNIHVYDRLHQEQELQSLNVNPQQQQQQFQQFSDYGLLQDMMNPVFPKQEE